MSGDPIVPRQFYCQRQSLGDSKGGPTSPFGVLFLSGSTRFLSAQAERNGVDRTPAETRIAVRTSGTMWARRPSNSPLIKPHREHRAAAGGVGGLDGAALRRDDHARKRKADAEAGLGRVLALVKPLEQVR